MGRFWGGTKYESLLKTHISDQLAPPHPLNGMTAPAFQGGKKGSFFVVFFFDQK